MESYRNQTNKSNFKYQNDKILKLIKNKIYPLNYADKSMLIFPKLKQKLNLPIAPDRRVRKQLQIDLKDQPNYNSYDEIYSKSEQKRNNNFNKDSQLKIQNNNRFSKICHTELPQMQTLIIQYKRKMMNRKEEQQQNSKLLEHKSSAQSQKTAERPNLQYLKNIRETINNNKAAFVHKLISERNNPYQKNISFQYVMNKLNHGKDSVKNIHHQAYQDISPNKIIKYLSLFKGSTQNQKDQYKQNQANYLPRGRKQVNKTQKHLVNSFKTCSPSDLNVSQENHIVRQAARQPTIISHLQNNQQYNSHKFINVSQSKMRIRNNHKKIIEMNKHSFKSLYM